MAKGKINKMSPKEGFLLDQSMLVGMKASVISFSSQEKEQKNLYTYNVENNHGGDLSV